MLLQLVVVVAGAEEKAPFMIAFFLACCVCISI